MDSKTIKKIVKPIVKVLGTLIAAALAGETFHKCREAYTRKKAMDAALRENNNDEDSDEDEDEMEETL